MEHYFICKKPKVPKKKHILSTPRNIKIVEINKYQKIQYYHDTNKKLPKTFVAKLGNKFGKTPGGLFQL